MLENLNVDKTMHAELAAIEKFHNQELCVFCSFWYNFEVCNLVIVIFLIMNTPSHKIVSILRTTGSLFSRTD